jgi:hypothetical protein
MSVRRVFQDVVLDDAPVESYAFSAHSTSARLEMDLADEQRASFVFDGVVGARQVPSVEFDRGRLYVDGSYCRSVVEVQDSEWIAQILSAARERGEPARSNMRHYIVPSDDWVWEIIARDCRRE